MPELTAATFKPVCNRSEASGVAAFALPDDGFIQIVPVGHAVSMEGVKQLVDEDALNLLLNSARGPGEMLMDREHESHDPTKRTDALAWLDLSTLTKREDGLYAKPRLTNSGSTEVLGGTLRYVSPEFDAASMQPAGNGRLRPTRLVGASFTNRPAFRQGKPVTNRDHQDIDPPDTKPMKKNLCQLLKLDEAATDEVVMNRLGEMLAKAAAHDTVAAELQTVKNREADDLILQHDAVIPKDKLIRDLLKDLILTNRVGADALIVGFKVAATDASDPAKLRAARTPVFNRGSAEAPTDDEKAKKAANARAATIKNRAQGIIDTAKSAGRTVNWNEAWATAESEQA